jgi:predicted dehydrogenase
VSVRVAFVGCDTPHVVDFARRLMHVHVDAAHWSTEAKVVAVYPGESAIDPSSIQGYVDTLRRYGVAVVADANEILNPQWRIDVVFVEAQDGSVHAAMALPYLRAGMPVFVDKPFACSVADAWAMVSAARQTGAWLCSASSLRFARELGDVPPRDVLGASTYSPASRHPRNPGLFHYGVHAVEMLYQLMGPGCREVTCASTEQADVVVGTWGDGRIGCLRGTRTGPHAYGFTAYCRHRVVAPRWTRSGSIRSCSTQCSGPCVAATCW